VATGSQSVWRIAAYQCADIFSSASAHGDLFGMPWLNHSPK
jgi:hypothetical protein